MPVIGATDITAEDGSFATWSAGTGTWLFVPGTTVMRTGVGSDSGVTPSDPPTPPVEPPDALSALVDAGSYYFPNGISAEEGPPGADPSLPYVLAVTSSPGNESMAGVAFQAGIQILTLLNDPTRVYRRGFTATDPVSWTPWILSGAAAAQQGGLSGIQGTLDDPTQLPQTGQPGDAWIIDGDLWVWR